MAVGMQIFKYSPIRICSVTPKISADITQFIKNKTKTETTEFGHSTYPMPVVRTIRLKGLNQQETWRIPSLKVRSKTGRIGNLYQTNYN